MGFVYKTYHTIFLMILLLCAMTVNTNAQSSEKDEPVTVDSVDLQQYTGTWYEIAKIPNRFQKSCTKNTTATYKLRDDGKIDVVNKCVEDNGDVNTAEGVARVVDTRTNAKLEVSFVSIFGFHLFWGDYWIIGLDRDYRYAVVGTPTRKYGWILSRAKKLTDAEKEKIFSILKKQGYDTGKFVFTEQD
jgi:apolipoprotein D and lipocalin family protein